MNTAVKMNIIVIDNYVVTNTKTGLNICPIRLAIKIHPTLNINSLKQITYGNKQEAAHILQQLTNGSMNFEDLIT